MNGHNQIPILKGHFRKRLIAQDACIINEDINVTPFRDGLIDHGLDFIFLGHIGAISNGFAACGYDFRHDIIRHSGPAARAIHRAAKVINDNFHAARGQSQSMATAQAATCPRHDCDAVFKFYCAHFLFPLRRLKDLTAKTNKYRAGSLALAALC